MTHDDARSEADSSDVAATRSPDEEIYRPLRIYRGGAYTARAGQFAPDRTATLCGIARGHTVLHVGCGDWPCTQGRLKNGTLLQAHLAAAATAIVGIDIEARAIQALQAARVGHCVVADAETLDLGETFERIIAGDMLEHVNNAGLVLEGFMRHLAPCGTVTIAVPNASSIGAIRALLNRGERVHKDHTAYYSPQTLSELARRFGLSPIALVYTVQPPGAWESRAFLACRHWLLRHRPAFAPGFIMTFQRTSEIDAAHFQTLD